MTVSQAAKLGAATLRHDGVWPDGDITHSPDASQEGRCRAEGHYIQTCHPFLMRLQSGRAAWCYHIAGRPWQDSVQSSHTTSCFWPDSRREGHNSKRTRGEWERDGPLSMTTYPRLITLACQHQASFEKTIWVWFSTIDPVDSLNRRAPALQST